MSSTHLPKPLQALFGKESLSHEAKRWSAILLAVFLVPAGFVWLGIPLLPDALRVSAHAMLETTVVVTAGFTLLMTLMRQRKDRELSMPLITGALLIAASLDSFHLLSWEDQAHWGNPNEVIGPYAWSIGRFSAASVMLIGVGLFCMGPKDERRFLNTKAHIVVLAAVAVAAWLVLVDAIHSPSLPQSLFPDKVVHRPYDLAPLGLFVLLGSVVLPLYSRRLPSPFAASLGLWVICQIVAQLYMAFGSTAQLDDGAMVAHAMKALGYMFVMGGMLLQFNMACVSQERLRTNLANALEEARVAALSKEEFLSAMSRQIRTPMNGVLGMTRLIRETGLNPEQEEYASAIADSADGLLGMMDNIRDFSVMEAGILELKQEPFNLEHLFDSFIEDLGLRSAGKPIQVSGCLPAGVITELLGDDKRIRQVLMSLGDNALKFTNEGEVSVRFGQVYDDGGTVKLRVEVQDTGIGIAPEDTKKVFRSFSQLSGSQQQDGNGLGLSIAKALVKLMGGEIGVISDGGGSTFWFTMRLKKQTASIGLDVPSLDELAGTRTIVADAGRGSRESIHTYLGGWGCRSTTVTDGWELLQSLRDAAEEDHPIHVALVDLELPGQDIEELCEKLTSDPAAEKTKLIALAPTDRAAFADFLRAGYFSAVLGKPIKKGMLRAAMHNVMGLRSQQPDPTPAARATPQVTFEGDPLAATGPIATGIRILLAEDNLVNQKVAAKHLEKMGCVVTIAGNGQEAVDSMVDNEFDMVLMDCQMPVMDGYDATRAIRALSTPAASVPIVAMTANVMAGDREKCLDAGMDDYVAKPFSVEDVERVFREWLPQLAG